MNPVTVDSPPQLNATPAMMTGTPGCHPLAAHFFYLITGVPLRTPIGLEGVGHAQ